LKWGNAAFGAVQAERATDDLVIAQVPILKTEEIELIVKTIADEA